MERTQKHALVDSLKKEFSNVSIIIVAHYKGLSVAELSELRNSLVAENVTLRVVKNTLSKLSVADGPFEKSLQDLFSGPTVLVYSEDPVAAAKGVSAFAKTNDKLIILGGATASEKLSLSQIQTLATLPSLDELRGKLVGLISAPARNTAVLINNAVSSVPKVLQAKVDSES